jgi:tripartite-type tricarboxylate transporter receptor subunit TctC
MKIPALVLATVLCAPAIDSARAQAYPGKAVRLVVGSAPGSGNDIAARIVAARMSESWGQQIVIENRPGANQAIAAELVARATPDGYTLLQCGVTSIAINPGLYPKLRYAPQQDFAPISLMATVPNVLVVHPTAPATTVGEFVAYIKANPGKFNYGSSGVGSTLHLSMEMLKSATGIRLEHVPYKGGALALADLLAGQVLAIFENVPVALPSVRAGKVRALGVTALKRSPQLPEVPTFEESGYPGFEITVWYGVCAPAAVPKPVLARLNAEVVKALNAPELRQRFADMGVEPTPVSVAQFSAFIKSETVKWAKAVKDSGARAD